MATKYADIIKIRPGKPAYSIEEERGTEWQSFIPNEQFNGVLKTVLRSVRGNDIDTHKSFWINGTYGTGKSHAVAVVTHLLSDPVDDIRSWVDYEYQDPKFASIREALFSLRKGKRLLPVKLESLNNLTHVSELAPLLQTKVVEALNNHDIEVAVDTDYDTMIAHITANPVIWDDLISRNVGLSSIVADRDMLVRKLRMKDPSTLQRARVALREAGLVVMLEKDSLASWLIEVQEQVRRMSDFTGLLILWDEFTDVMEDAVGIPVLKELQTVAQKFMNQENDSFLFLISHPSAFNKLGTEATKQTDGRYHRMKYNMESVSAFKIMSRKFEIVDQAQHRQRTDFFYRLNGDLVERYISNSNNPAETREDLYKLFPLHPGTANLATHYATVIGSSSRSVFEFIGQNDAIRNFLDSREAYAQRDTVTPDYLWDFVLGVFQDDVANYGAVTERFNTYRHRVEHRGEAAMAIFKSLLLLNAFNNIASDDSVTPTEQNIRALYAGTKYEQELDGVLDWINNEGVIQKAPGGIFSVQFSALPSHELEDIKETLYATEFRFTSQILKFGDTARNFFEKKYVQKNLRPYTFEFYSEDTNDAVLRNRIKNGKRATRPSDLYLALLYARDNRELAHLRQAAEEMSRAGTGDDKELKDIIFVVVDTVFGEKDYARFIEYMASYKAAGNHGFMDQVNVHRDHALEMIKEWMQNALRGNATVWVNGESVPISIKHLPSVLNGFVAPVIYPKGPDAWEPLRQKAPGTFWKPQVSKEMIRNFIFGTTKSEVLELNGMMKPVQHLIQDALDENLEWKRDVAADHPFKAVYDYVNSTIRNFISHGNTSVLFDLTERFADLTRPPYGLADNFATAAMMAFAMRPWINKIYDTVGKPRTADNVADDVAALIKYWQNGKSGSKLSFKFQTPQEGKLCRELVKLFKLNKLAGYSDVSSMKDARYAITGVFLAQKGYPLWSLKYMTGDFIRSMPVLTVNDRVLTLIDNLVAICEEKDQKNVQLVTSTLDLIERYRADFPNILNKEGSFRNGFENFLRSVPNVSLKEEEMEAAYDYITKNLQSTVGYWSENEVTDALKDWRIAGNLKIEEERRKQEQDAENKIKAETARLIEEERRKHQEEIEAAAKIKGNPDNVAVKVKWARQKINTMQNPALLRQILDRLIDLGYEQVLDVILK